MRPVLKLKLRHVMTAEKIKPKQLHEGLKPLLSTAASMASRQIFERLQDPEFFKTSLPPHAPMSKISTEVYNFLREKYEITEDTFIPYKQAKESIDGILSTSEIS